LPADTCGRSTRRSERLRAPGVRGCQSRGNGRRVRYGAQPSASRDAPRQTRPRRPARFAPLAGRESRPPDNTLTTVRLALVVGGQSLPEAWRRHGASVLRALARPPERRASERARLPNSVCLRPAAGRGRCVALNEPLSLI